MREKKSRKKRIKKKLMNVRRNPDEHIAGKVGFEIERQKGGGGETRKN